MSNIIISPSDEPEMFERPYAAHIEAFTTHQAEESAKPPTFVWQHYDIAADEMVVRLSDGSVMRHPAHYSQFQAHAQIHNSLNGLGSNSLGTTGFHGHSSHISAPSFGLAISGNTISGVHFQNNRTSSLAQHQLAIHAKNDPKQPDTLGWREWVWDAENKCLKSPSQGTLWPAAEHAATHWSKEDAVRGVAGIHALLVPRHWKILHELNVQPLGGSIGTVVTGIVERFGKYVLGTEGWRAEQVIIRELLAPSTEIGLELEQCYPDAIVHYSDQLEEGEQPCKSVKSSKSGKGSRSLLPSLPVLALPPQVLSSQPSLALSQVQSLPNGLWLVSPPSARKPLPEGLSVIWIGVCIAWVLVLSGWAGWLVGSP